MISYNLKMGFSSFTFAQQLPVPNFLHDKCINLSQGLVRKPLVCSTIGKV